MNKQELSAGMDNVEKLASASRWRRLFRHPFRYAQAMLFGKLIYPATRNPREVSARTFFGRSMNLLLPAGTDIYLTGGKTHGSEIRLARYMISQLNIGNVFVDVGAHYGYFSLLAADLVGKTGRVISLEASPSTFRLLESNVEQNSRIDPHNFCVSDVEEEIPFYEFPALYSEYNTTDVGQFREEGWFAAYPPRELKLQAHPLDGLLEEWDVIPDMIKIDVEGSEDKAVKGLGGILKEHSPAAILEYLSEERGHRPHREAELQLRRYGYFPHRIDPSGKVDPLENVPEYLDASGLDSDNIVFLKK